MTNVYIQVFPYLHNCKNSVSKMYSSTSQICTKKNVKSCTVWLWTKIQHFFRTPEIGKSDLKLKKSQQNLTTS